MSRSSRGFLRSGRRQVGAMAALLGASLLLAPGPSARGEDSVYIGKIPPEYETYFDNYKPKYRGTVRGLDGRTATIMLDDPNVEGVGRDVPTLWHAESRCQTTLAKPELVSTTPRRYRLRVRPGVKRKDSMCRRFGSFAPVAGSVYVTLRRGAAGAFEYDVELAAPNLDLTGKGDAGENVFARGTLETGATLARFPHASWFDESRLRNEAKLAPYPAFLEGSVTDRDGVQREISLHRILFRGEKVAKIAVYDGYSGCLYLSDSRIRQRVLDRKFGISLEKHEPSSALSLECDMKRAFQVHGKVRKGKPLRMFDGLDLTPAGAEAFRVTVRPMPAISDEIDLATGTLRRVAGQPMVVDYTPDDGLRSVAGHYLINNYGLYRLEHRTGTGVTIYLIEGTDVLAPFSVAEKVGDGYWDPEEQTLSTSFLKRVERGLCESEGPSEFRKYRAAFDAGAGAAGRYWTGGGQIGQSLSRACATEIIDGKTCKRIECLRWRDEVPYFDETWLLVRDEGLAKRLYANVPKWTLSSLRLPTSAGRVRSRSPSPSIFSPGSCGFESCYDKEMRQLRDDYLQSLW